jgi:hypothetical protein
MPKQTSEATKLIKMTSNVLNVVGIIPYLKNNGTKKYLYIEASKGQKIMQAA